MFTFFVYLIGFYILYKIVRWVISKSLANPERILDRAGKQKTGLRREDL